MKYLSVLGDMSEIVIKKLLDQWKSKEQPISKNERLVVMTITIKNLLAFLLILILLSRYIKDVFSVNPQLHMNAPKRFRSSVDRVDRVSTEFTSIA